MRTSVVSHRDDWRYSPAARPDLEPFALTEAALAKSDASREIIDSIQSRALQLTVIVAAALAVAWIIRSIVSGRFEFSQIFGAFFGVVSAFAYVLFAMIISVALPPLTPTARRVARFEAAWRMETKRQRAMQAAFWTKLSGLGFEVALANVLRKAGYDVTTTPYSGDGGVDLVLRHEGRTILVQCKATAAPVSPGVMRELYGTLLSSKADAAILAATGGVTSGVRAFALGKPLAVLDLPGILAMAGGRDHLAALLQATLPRKAS